MDSIVAKNSVAVEEAALRWLVRQHGDQWSPADQAQFDAWLEAADAHRIQYIRARRAWKHTERLKALGAGIAPGVVPPPRSWGDARFFRGVPAAKEDDTGTSKFSVRPATPGRPIDPDNFDTPAFSAPSSMPENAEHSFLELLKARSAEHFRLAAAILIVFAAGTYALTGGWFTGTRYSTAVGAIDDVTLLDGSHVTLNTDTRIRVSLTKSERRIDLERGEAFFDVARDTARPFVVYAGDRRVQAVGTKFSVRRERDDLQVIVTEGRVQLAPAEIHDTKLLPIERTSDNVPTPQSAYLNAGAIARTSKEKVTVRTDAVAQAEKILSWRRGYVYFDNVALAEAVAEFNRYNTHKMFIEDPSIAALRVGGNFRINNSEAFLEFLRTTFPIEIEQQEQTTALKGISPTH